MSNNYPMRVYCDQNGEPAEWVVEYPGLPGCIGVGDTVDAAIIAGEANKNLWIETALENGVNIPDPNQQYSSEFSGKFNLRIPKYLHRELALLAEEQGVSLNTLCISVLSNSTHILTEPSKNLVVETIVTEKSCGSSVIDVDDNWNLLTTKRAPITQVKRPA